MKKRNELKVLVVGMMVMLFLVSCGTGKEGDASTMPSQEENIISGNNTNEADKKPGAENSDGQGGDGEIDIFDTSVTIGETVLVDENNVKITATELMCDKNDVNLYLSIENNSDKDLSFIAGSMGYCCNAINGYMVSSGYLNVDVAAGKKANEKVKFSVDELRVFGITKIADIQIGFDIEDEERNDIYTGPKKIKTSYADSYDYAVDTYQTAITSNILKTVYGYTLDYFGKEEIYNKNGVRVTSQALLTNKDGEKAVFLEFENGSDQEVRCALSDIAINGLVISSGRWTSDSVNAHGRRIMDVSLESLLGENYRKILEISEIGVFSGKVSVEDSNGNEIGTSQEISFSNSSVKSDFNEKGKDVYNEGGIRIISKGLVEGDSSYDDDIYMVFLVENKSAETICIDVKYKSLSVNGYMMDFFAYSKTVPSKGWALYTVDIRGNSLEDNGIEGKDSITEAELIFEIEDEYYYKDIAEPKVQITY